MWWMAALASVAPATTFPPAPPLGEQLAGVDVAGVYVVEETRTVTLEDGFVATRARIVAVGEPVRGDVRKATLGVPGGEVAGRYVDGLEGAPRLEVGDTVFAFLQPHDDRYILTYGFESGIWRKVETTAGAIMTDGEGAVVTGVSCDQRPARERGKPPLSWDRAVAAFAACGGAE